MSRRFITRSDIDDAADAGDDVLVVDDQTTVTDLAREHARERGVRIERDGAPSSTHGEELATVVRSTVIQRLGHEPDGLDTAIRSVLSRARS